MSKLGITLTAVGTALVAATAALASPTATAKDPSAMKEATWRLQTDDTALALAVRSNRLFITGLKHTGQPWEWVPAPAEVPMPGTNSLKVADTMASPVWVYQDATETKTNGHLLVLRFTSDSPALELKSYWQALPGPGPVENWVVIENQSTAAVEYHVVGMPAAQLNLRAEKPVRVHRAANIAAGVGQVAFTPLEANGRVTTGTRELPFVLLDVEARHGMYLGFEWELGGFNLAAGADPLDIAVSVHPLTHVVKRGPKESFWIPRIYYGVYRGRRQRSSSSGPTPSARRSHDCWTSTWTSSQRCAGIRPSGMLPVRRSPGTLCRRC